jgi:hypothetical protein
VQVKFKDGSSKFVSGGFPVYEEQVLLTSSDEQCYVMKATVRTPTVPYGDNLSVDVSYW